MERKNLENRPDELLREIRNTHVRITKYKCKDIIKELEALKQSIINSGAIERLTEQFYFSKYRELVSIESKVLKCLEVRSRKLAVFSLVIHFLAYVATFLLIINTPFLSIHIKYFPATYTFNIVAASTILTLFTLIIRNLLYELSDYLKRGFVSIGFTLESLFFLVTVAAVYLEAFFVYPHFSDLLTNLAENIGKQNLLSAIFTLLLILSEVASVAAAYFVAHDFFKRKSEDK